MIVEVRNAAFVPVSDLLSAEIFARDVTAWLTKTTESWRVSANHRNFVNSFSCWGRQPETNK